MQLKPQIGLRIHDGEKLPLEELLPLVREKGFSCGHIALSKSCGELPFTPRALSVGYAMYLKRLFAENKLDIAVLGCYLNLAEPNPEKLSYNLSMYKAHLRFASILGCGVVGTETGAPNSAYAYEPECRSARSLDTLVTNLKTVVEWAEKLGVIVAIEPVYKHIVYDAKRAREVLDRLASPNLQIIFDPVNLLGEDNYEQRDKVISQAIELLRDDIAVVHLKDFTLDNGKLHCLEAGGGMMDYTRILRFIKREKPYIQVTLENTKPENAAAARAHIERLYDRI